jgi:hypothetical protein
VISGLAKTPDRPPGASRHHSGQINVWFFGCGGERAA